MNEKNSHSVVAQFYAEKPALDERTLFEHAYLTFGTRAEEQVAVMRDVNGDYVCNETKDSWMTWQFARGMFEADDAFDDWVDQVVVHVNECDASLVTLEGHYKHLEHHLKDCDSVDEGNALAEKLRAFLTTRPSNRARVADVAAALARI